MFVRMSQMVDKSIAEFFLYKIRTKVGEKKIENQTKIGFCLLFPRPFFLPLFEIDT
jgi:hypothetical protein